MAQIINHRTLTCKEGRCKVTAFVLEMSDKPRWYTTKGGHVAFNTDDKIVSGTQLNNLSDNDLFSFYGEYGKGIETIGQFHYLVEEPISVNE